MNIALIAQISVGVAFPGALSVWMFAPNWLGIYSDLDIYLTDAEVPQSTDSSSGANSSPTAQDNALKNEKNMKCWIKEHTKHDCAIYVITIADDSKNSINVNQNFTTQLTSISNSSNTNNAGTSVPSTAATKYYKITVSEKLLGELQANSGQTISVSAKGTDKPSLTLKPLFVNNQSKITSLDVEKAIEHYIGKAIKIDETEITKTDKYRCSFFQNNFKDCNIFNLQTGDTATTSLDNFTFTSTETESTKIKENNFYLIKGNGWNKNFYVTSATVDTVADNTKMNINNPKSAFVLDVSGTKTLFHFA